MSSRTPIVRQISWLASIPQIIALTAAIFIASRLSPSNGFLWGAGAFLFYSIGSRYLIARDHRTGISLVKGQRFREAIPRFQKSLEFFDRHPWVDRGRSVALMSASATSYREMALANIAFCYSQIGDGVESRRYYEKCLERFPESGIALAALRMMDASSQVSAK